MRLRGHTEALAGRRGRMLSPDARGANQTAPHGTLQRLSDGSCSLVTSTTIASSVAAVTSTVVIGAVAAAIVTCAAAIPTGEPVAPRAPFTRQEQSPKRQNHETDNDADRDEHAKDPSNSFRGHQLATPPVI